VGFDCEGGGEKESECLRGELVFIFIYLYLLRSVFSPFFFFFWNVRCDDVLPACGLIVGYICLRFVM